MERILQCKNSSVLKGIMIDGENKRFTLEEAANKVNISKKSLDDYLL